MKYLLIPAIALMAAVASAADYTVKTGTTDWTVKESYTLKDGSPADKVPGAEDWVTVPNGTYTVDIDSASFGVISNFFGMEPAGYSVTINIDVPAGREAALGCAITSRRSKEDGDSDYRRGTIVKTGLGVLHFLAHRRAWINSSETFDYYTSFDVQAGRIAFVQDTGDGSKYYGKINVASGAEVWAGSYATKDANFCPSEIAGSGMITNACSRRQVMYVMNSQWLSPNGSVFAGTIGGDFATMFSGPIYLTGTASTFSSTMTSFMSGNHYCDMAGITGVQSFGKTGQPSSIGTYGTFTIGDHGGGYCYLGTGETTDKSVNIAISVNSPSIPATFDGGPYGGLVFASGTAWGPTAVDVQKYRRILLTGTNAAPCETYANIQSWNYSGKIPNYTFSVKKEGSGQWNVMSTNSTMTGTFTVEEGTLGFGYVNEVGRPSSFGLSTNLTEWYDGTLDATKRVNWAVNLGTATLALANERNSRASGRPLVISGTGVLSNSTASSALRWENISAIGGVARTLVLDGTNTLDNTVADVTDDAIASDGSTLGIEKRGAGTWRLARNQTFSGPLAVKEGTLVVENSATLADTWFRFTILENQGTYMNQMQEFVLYDETGHRQNTGFVYHQPPRMPNTWRQTDAEIAFLEPGEVTYQCDDIYTADDDRDLDKMFDDYATSAGWYAARHSQSSTYNPKPDNPSTWLPVVMRLTNGTPEIVACDLVQPAGAGVAIEIKQWMLEGSVDGVRWHTLTNVTYDQAYYAKGTTVAWLSDLTRQSRWSPGQVRPGQGYLFNTRGCDGESFAVLENVSSVSVAPGATLKASGAVTLKTLALDGAGNGAIDGFTFAETGTLDVANVPREGFTAKITNATGLDNLAKWTVQESGQPATRYCISVAGDQVSVRRRGLVLVIY